MPGTFLLMLERNFMNLYPIPVLKVILRDELLSSLDSQTSLRNYKCFGYKAISKFHQRRTLIEKINANYKGKVSRAQE